MLTSGIKPWLKRLRWFRHLYFIYASWRARHGGLPDWARLLNCNDHSWQLEQEETGKRLDRVLIATGTAGHLPSMTVESLLGVALSVRHANVDFFLCDGALPACMMCEINWYADVVAFSQKGPVDRCRSCWRPAVRMLCEAGFNYLGLSGQLTDAERESARSLSREISPQVMTRYVLDGIAIGEHAMAGTLRFYARGDLDGLPEAEVVQRRFFEAAVLAYYASRRIFRAGHYGVVVLNHGIYVPQGIIAETARQFGVRVVTWHPAYRRGCFIFNHDETYHHGLRNEPVCSWERMLWNKNNQERIIDYLQSRWVGLQDWVRFHQDPEFDVAVVCSETGVNFSRPTIGLLTNVVWDAQLHYKANVFNNMLDWLIKTIIYFEKRHDIQLLIRVHPAEIKGTIPTRQPAVEEIHKAFPQLPENVFIIRPESKLSTYMAMSQCNAVIIYGTKTGVELTSLGIPVIVAGEAWIRGKGITLDAESEEDYFRLLDSLPITSKLDEIKKERALKYAFHFFFRRMIPLDCIKERKGWPPFEVSISGINDILPEILIGLDVVCEGIMNGTPFIYPAELMKDDMVSRDS